MASKTQKTEQRLTEVRGFIKRHSGVFEALILIGLAYVASQGLWLGLRFALQTECPARVVTSESMVPTYRIGDVIIVQGVTDKGQIEIGDVIVFHEPGDWDSLIVHRVMNKTYVNGEWYFLTKGDNEATNPYPDPGYLWPIDAPGTYNGWLPADNIVGRVIARIPFVGPVIMVMQSPMGPVIIILLIVAILITSMFSQKQKEETTSICLCGRWTFPV